MHRERQSPQNVLNFILLNTFNKESVKELQTHQRFRVALLGYTARNLFRKKLSAKTIYL